MMIIEFEESIIIEWLQYQFKYVYQRGYVVIIVLVSHISIITLFIMNSFIH